MNNANPNPSQNWIPAVAVLVIMFFVMVVVAITAIPQAQPSQEMTSALGAVPPPLSSREAATAHPQPTRVQPTRIPMGNCPDNWYASEDRVLRDTCAKLKEINGMKERAAEIATMEAQPFSPTIPNFTPQTLLPPPAFTKEVRQIPFDDPYTGPPPFQWKGATSVWQMGGVPNSDYTSWVGLYVVTRPSSGAQSAQQDGDKSATTNTTSTNPTLETMLLEGLDGGLDARYTRKWVFPQAAKELYITGITKPDVNIPNAKTPYPGLQGVVSFKTDSGLTGKFDLEHENWILDAPPATP